MIDLELHADAVRTRLENKAPGDRHGNVLVQHTLFNCEGREILQRRWVGDIHGQTFACWQSGGRKFKPQDRDLENLMKHRFSALYAAQLTFGPLPGVRSALALMPKLAFQRAKLSSSASSFASSAIVLSWPGWYPCDSRQYRMDMEI